MIEEMRINTNGPKGDRGLDGFKFLDSFGEECSFQESSVDGGVWLGCNQGTIYNEQDQRVELPGYRSLGRMHLSRSQAEAVGKMLLHWVKTEEVVHDPDIVVLTSDQFSQLVDCLGPASEDILDGIFPGRNEEEEEEG